VGSNPALPIYNSFHDCKLRISLAPAGGVDVVTV
jgi:hypothetical protein